jgi:hypothetical protein
MQFGNKFIIIIIIIIIEPFFVLAFVSSSGAGVGNFENFAFRNLYIWPRVAINILSFV